MSRRIENCHLRLLSPHESFVTLCRAMLLQGCLVVIFQKDLVAATSQCRTEVSKGRDMAIKCHMNNSVGIVQLFNSPYHDFVAT